MIVWIVERVWEYDGSMIEKVFLDESKAKEYCRTNIPTDILVEGKLKYDSFKVGV